MNTRPFFQVVPAQVKLWAWIAVIGAVATGLSVAVWATAAHHASPWTILLYSAAGLFIGLLFATWLLGLGFVFADARRRAMRPVLWVFVCILFPHLLGFLLYFVMRQPLASPCGHCGQAVPSGQRFCSWCGSLQAHSRSADGPPPFGQGQGASR
ncbi:MAG TPA: zinc ribbon domain-containing protein [Acidobacteriaceae bacterium]